MEIKLCGSVTLKLLGGNKVWIYEL